MDEVATPASQLLAEARAALVGAPREGLGEERVSRWRGRRIVRIGDAWHLGVLLLTDTHALATAEVLRAADPGRRGYTAESARERAERRAEALRGGFAEGEVAHVGWSVIDVDAVDAGGASGPLGVVDGVPSVHWSTAGGWMPLEAYLRERVELLRG
ncbi:glutaminase [Microbacterium hydrocarbonoxydans]|uniref:glutaminase n=1 Tax=Microbacterium hydrocarbonoxydans TaxID=273678 RepID=UPI00203BA1CC|nr:glutaminase [Microbacterium hydrocarbonoxydans]MCM3779807.1 glutaminase [Microbacterium hydrocarbonoxydans]